jgi:hypothetical protein
MAFFLPQHDYTLAERGIELECPLQLLFFMVVLQVHNSGCLLMHSFIEWKLHKCKCLCFIFSTWFSKVIHEIPQQYLLAFIL